MLRKTMMKRTGVALMAAALLAGTAMAHQGNAQAVRPAGGTVVLVGDVGDAVQAPAAWLQEDPGSRAYTTAREALNARKYQEAAEAFAAKQLLHEPFMGGGLWTGAAIPLLIVLGGWPIFGIAIGVITIWTVVLMVMNRKTDD